LQDISDDAQLSDQKIQGLIEKQNEVLKILEQLELRLNKLDVKFPDAKDSVPILEKEQSTQCNVQKKPISSSKPVTKNDVENLIKVRLLFLFMGNEKKYQGEKKLGTF